MVRASVNAGSNQIENRVRQIGVFQVPPGMPRASSRRPLGGGPSMIVNTTTSGYRMQYECVASQPNCGVARHQYMTPVSATLASAADQKTKRLKRHLLM